MTTPTHCCQVPDCVLHRLQFAQNSAACLLSGTNCRQHITPVLEEFHWLPVHQCIAFKILSITYQAVHSDSAPSYLKGLAVQDQQRLLHSNSSVVQLLVPCTKKNIGEHSGVRGPKLCKTLPTSLRNCNSHLSFKRNLKIFLFMQQFYS